MTGTPYDLNPHYFDQNQRKYAQYTTVVAPLSTENKSQILSTENTIYTISSVHAWQGVEIYNNTSTAIVYVDLGSSMGNSISSAQTLSAYGMPIRALTYYYFGTEVFSAPIRIMSDLSATDVRIIGHF
jgi:hypothetical protein